MRQTLFFIPAIFIACLFSACRNDATSRIFSIDNLPITTVAIAPERDTTVRTPKGASIRIRKGTFARNVELEIREAYTMADIFTAGLQTTSGGKALSSGGMIYIGAKGNDGLKPALPIDVSIPTAYANPKMQLYKGTEGADGEVAWADPEPLANTSDTTKIALGKAIFNANCTSCHSFRCRITGPALAGLTQRGPWKNPKALATWIRNPARFMARNKYTQRLKSEYGAIMSGFPALSSQSLSAVIAYLQAENANPDADLEYNLQRQLEDSTWKAYRCDSTSIAQTIPAASPDSWNDTLWTETDPEVIETDPLAMEGLDQAIIFSFSVFDLGWYNIDMLTKNLPNSVAMRIEVKAKDDALPTYLEAVLLIPRYKALLQAIADGDKFGNFIVEGYDLPKDAEAVMVVYGGQGKNFVHGSTPFVLSGNRTVNVVLTEHNEEALRQMLIDGTFEEKMLPSTDAPRFPRRRVTRNTDE